MTLDSFYIMERDEPLKVYFAGKVRDPTIDYRSLFFGNPSIMLHDIGCVYGFPTRVPQSVHDGSVQYGGPSAISAQDAGYRSHRLEHEVYDVDAPVGHAGWEFLYKIDELGGLSSKQILYRCMYQIRMCDAMYVYIDSLDCYGTIAEIGYAYALGKPIHVVIAKELDTDGELWFAESMATTVDYGNVFAGARHIISRLPDLKYNRKAKNKRRSISQRLRVDVLIRDNYTCQMCGVGRQDGAILEIDHIHPVSKGGTNDPKNLQVLCRECNGGKSNRIVLG
jgi:hypothetical protein